MSFFKNIFNASAHIKATQNKIDWIELNDIAQLDEISILSTHKPVAIFKHSTRCTVSRMALKQFENEFNNPDKVTLYFLDLIAHRAISNQIAHHFGIPHESPQLLLIKNTRAVYNVSHNGIDAQELVKKISTLI